MGIDPVKLAVLKGRLEQIADEMDVTLFRSAFNPIIAEAHDACHGLYDRLTGDTLVQGKSGLPIFVGTMAFAVRAIIEKFKDTMAEGDVYIFNDPYDGGSHLNDFKLVSPFYCGGELVCFLASVGHWLDVAGNVPGNFNAQATECFQEGFLLPPVKIIERGTINPAIVDVIKANSRTPDSNYGDLYGQINALEIGKKRLRQLTLETGPDLLLTVFGELKLRASKMMKNHISKLADGKYAFHDFLDNDGIDSKPLKIHLEIEVAADQLKFDFQKTSDSCAGPLNISRATTEAACYVALKHVFPDVPANSGCLEPISFDIPEHSLLAARQPQPVRGLYRNRTAGH